MSGLNIDPSKAMVPFKSHKTLSNAEWQRRMKATYELLVRRLCKKAAAHFRAKIAWYKQMPEIEAEENKIDEWENLHRDKPRLSKRLHAAVYPWEQRITSKHYSKILHKRKTKLQLRMKRTELELEATRSNLEDEVASINSGLAWLMEKPAKIPLKSNFLNGHPYERMADDQGRERIIIRNALVERLSGALQCDIVSIDPDEIIVSDPDECRSVRSLGGIRQPRLKKTDALLGDGVRYDNSFWLVGKAGDRGYLDAAIGYHFFYTNNRERSGQCAVDFKTNDFLAYRREITNAYAGNRTKFSRFHASPLLNGGRIDYVVFDRNFLSDGRSAQPKALHKRSFRSEPSFKGVYNSGGMISEGEVQSRYCDPSSWACYTEELKKALLMLDRNRSFIIDGAAGTGKTHMIPAMVNYCLAIGKSVKVMVGGGTLDVIEARCHDFMVERKGHKFPMGWVREANYMIFGSTHDPRDDDQNRGYEASSVARFSSYLFRPPNHDKADVLIFDDATRITFDSSLFNGRPQFVALGDFSQISCQSSVFAVARSSDFAMLSLRKNHRARNCDAVTWSNIFSYQNSLTTAHRGIRRSELRYVPLGRKRDGVIRGEVRAIINAARQALLENESVGIVAFSQKQLEAISDAFQKAKLTDLSFLGLPEDVQGREADCVLVSLNAALTPKGRLPFEIDGFEDEQRVERMNVALSRARQRTIVFSCLLASDIDLRLATDAQALIRSVLQTFELLPSQVRMASDMFYNPEPA